MKAPSTAVAEISDRAAVKNSRQRRHLPSNLCGLQQSREDHDYGRTSGRSAVEIAANARYVNAE